MRGTGRARKFEHVLVAERAMGKPLPVGAQVHHINGNRTDNRNGNLVVCQDQSYHALLHARRRALDACGNPGWRRCTFCREWDDVKNLRYYGSKTPRHAACQARDSRLRRTAK
jgi:hypothetical protein